MSLDPSPSSSSSSQMMDTDTRSWEVDLRVPTPTPSLPPYSPSQLTPAYSSNPRDDEERLAITEREGLYASSRPIRTGTFTTSTRRGVAITLLNQEPNASIPCFGKNARICGMVNVAGGYDVESVEVLLEGHLKLTIAEGGKKTKSLFSSSHTVWSRSPHNPPCPESLPFVIAMPYTYTDNDRVRPLPPSYQVIFPGVPGLFAHSIYNITVRVTRERRLLRRKIDTLQTEMRYHPRTRAPRPILKPTLPFFTIIKIAPEEFCQVQSSMKSRARSALERIHCLLFIPSSCIYAITEEIPFHLQLVGRMSSLLSLLCCADTSHHNCSTNSDRTFAADSLRSLHRSYFTDGTSDECPQSRHHVGRGPSHPMNLAASSVPDLLRTYAHSQHESDDRRYLHSHSNASTSLLHTLQSRLAHTLTNGTPKHRRRTARPVIRVFLLRQITVEVRGQKAWRTCVLGEGVMAPTASSTSGPQRRRSSNRSSSPDSPQRDDFADTDHQPESDYVHVDSPSKPHHFDTFFDEERDPDDEDDLDPTLALDWDGTLRVASPEEVQVGGFAAWPPVSGGGLMVKDFVVLSIVPPEPARNELVEHQWAHPVRLVTDPGRSAGVERDWCTGHVTDILHVPHSPS
ncbi:hypothetical protein SCHPADRAFT_1002801 [Schizopora paradoxa]|uniref:Uncharacterized protein n=1 Tax=Schizopora paradoxa TaxID=27342 RepID=A0A0H2RLC2_9AGAM|nr:hypothetical protein SCHPADRAFT_1002801 [Schizopora paradoxa]